MNHEIKNGEQNHPVPGFDELPPIFLIRGLWAGGVGLRNGDKPLNEALRESINRMSPEQKVAFRQRLIDISEKFGSGGP
jgi:hypothetical protein